MQLKVNLEPRLPHEVPGALRLAPGEARCPAPSVQEIIQGDAQKAPPVLAHEHYEYLGSDDIERAVESNTQPPIASLDGPYTSAEGSSVSMSASASVDLNGTIVSYAWRLGDGSTASGMTISHTYVQDGDYAVRLIVTDNDALADTINTTVHVANVAPVVGAFAGATVLPVLRSWLSCFPR